MAYFRGVCAYEEGRWPLVANAVRVAIKAAFGDRLYHNKQERALRLLEESAEYLQTTGATLKQAMDTLMMVYSKPVHEGPGAEELGGVALCLIAAADADDGQDPLYRASEELRRVRHPEDMLNMRAKNYRKMLAGAGFYGKDMCLCACHRYSEPLPNMPANHKETCCGHLQTPTNDEAWAMFTLMTRNEP